MKTLMVYYSHYGNTAYATDKFYTALEKLGKVDMRELEYLEGQKGLFTRILYRLFPSMIKLVPVVSDLKDYDLLFLGIPVWGGRPSGAVVKYLSLCKNLKDKKVICCYVYGIEASAQACAKYVRRILNRKGHPFIVDAYVPWVNIQTESTLADIIQATLDKLLQKPT